jgi:hypothetical protein
MVFSLSLDKTHLLYTDDADHTDSSVKDGKIRPLRDIRVPRIIASDFEKAIGYAGRGLVQHPE